MEQKQAVRFLIGHFVLTVLLLAGSWFLSQATKTPELFVFGIPLRIFDVVVVTNSKGGWDSWVMNFYWFNLLIDILSPGLLAAAFALEMKMWKRFALGGLILVLMAAAVFMNEGGRFTHEERDFKPLHWSANDHL